MANSTLESLPDGDTDSDRASTDARPGVMPTGGDRQPPSIKTTSAGSRYGGAVRVSSDGSAGTNTPGSGAKSNVMMDRRGGLGKLEPTGHKPSGGNRALSSGALGAAESDAGKAKGNLYRSAGLDEAEAGVGGGKFAARIKGI